MAKQLKRRGQRTGVRLYFEKTVRIPASGDSPEVVFEAGLWYDGVSAEHAAIAGDAAVPISLDHDCGCLRLPDGRALVTKTRHVPALDGNGNRYERPMTHVEIAPHAEACAFEEEE